MDSTGVAAAGGGRNGSRWYEIENMTTTPSLKQAGTLFDPAGSTPRGFWVPTVAMSGQGHMALGSSTASAVDFAGIAVSGRLADDPLGATQPFTLAQASATAYNRGGTPNSPQRWGDYSRVDVDPTDDMTMWAFQEYCNATNSWGVQAIQLSAPPPAMPAAASPPSVARAQSSVDVTITGSSSAGSGFFDPGADTGGPGYPEHLTASVSDGVTVNSVTFIDPTHVTLHLSTLCTAPGAKDVTVTNPDGQSSTGVGVLTVTGSEPGICGLPGPCNDCVPGSGRKSTECFIEWAPSPVPPRTHDLTPKSSLICYEGDPHCDTDGIVDNNSCTMQTRMCINNTDPRLPDCLPHEIAKFQVSTPRPSSTLPGDQTNLQTLEAQGGAAGFGVSVYRGMMPDLCRHAERGAEQLQRIAPHRGAAARQSRQGLQRPADTAA